MATDSALIGPRIARGRVRRRVVPRVRASAIEALGVFAIGYAFYLLVGHQLVVDQHVVVFDATARLAHGYFVWWNDPPKLASIGFVWAPISTLVFLPFTLIKPLATSLMALPATSGFFAAVMLAVLARTLGRLGLRWWMRLTMVALFGLNPMIVYYAINGMSEAPFLCLLTIAVSFLLRWHLERTSQHLALAGVFIALAFLCRYELFAFGAVLALCVPILLMRARRSPREVEASTVVFVAPLVYGTALWIFFNWLILGDAFYWLTQQLSGGGDSGTGASAGAVADAATNTATANSPVQDYVSTQPGLLEIVQRVVELNVRLFPLWIVVVIGLAVVGWSGWRRRDAMAWVLGALCLVNVATTTALIFRSGDVGLLQLRYNMRVLPIVLIGAGWLVWSMRGRWQIPMWALLTAVLAISIPVTWHTMKTFPFQYQEKVFVRAIETGDDQAGSDTGGQYTVGNSDDKEMADYLKAHVPLTTRAILTDDAQTFGVMLASGRPDAFLDRIDKGDGYWKRVLQRPWGRVRYLLIARYPRPPFEAIDEVVKRYPGMEVASLPGVSVEHANPHYILLRLAPKRPTAKTRFSDVVKRAVGDHEPRL